MKKFIIPGIICFVLVAYPAFAKKYLNVPILEKVERNPAVENVENTPNAETGGTGTNVENGTYKDNLLSITWDPDPKGFYFDLVNLSQSPLTVAWQECFISDGFSNYAVVHAGVKYVREMPATEIDPGKNLKDNLYPSAYCKFERGKVSSIRPKAIYKKKLKEKDVTDGAFSPRTFVVTLALDSGGTRYTYKFHFKTSAVELQPK
jgi:hypothetical protein